jgi:hypothetical protein
MQHTAQSTIYAMDMAHGAQQKDIKSSFCNGMTCDVHSLTVKEGAEYYVSGDLDPGNVRIVCWIGISLQQRDRNDMTCRNLCHRTGYRFLNCIVNEIDS